MINASLHDHLPIVEYLVSNGADINYQKEDGWAALIVASFNGRLSVVEYLLSHGASINDKTNNGYTALICASEKGHPSIVQYLLSKGASVNDQTTSGNTALHRVCCHNPFDSIAIEIIKILVANGADITLQNNEHKTPVEYAKNDTLRNAITQAARETQVRLLYNFYFY